jgi:hypothetical protein
MKKLILPVALLVATALSAQQKYWNMKPDGSIKWTVKPNEVHTDHLEMSGKQISAIVRYGIDSSGSILISRKLVFPMLRTIPNDTRGNLIRELSGNIIDSVFIDQQRVKEQPVSFTMKGCLQSTSILRKGIFLERKIFPATDKPAYIESYSIRNNTNHPVTVHIPSIDSNSMTDEKKGVYGSYIINYKVYNSGSIIVDAGNEHRFWVVISARKKSDEPYYYSDEYEWQKRSAFVNDLDEKLVLQTPNDTINRMFAFAKIRAAESIYDTKQGLMHGPGGGEYYAAIWANDQAEYINPFFAYLGNAAGIESARNSFRLFASYINPSFQPIPSSIIAEGTGFWNGAGDRGDQAMIGYGASLFALTYADKTEANSLWTLIEWCNQYLLRRKTAEGVIASESDELEGRFPAGKINLSTNVLAYGSFLYGARLAEALGKTAIASDLKKEAQKLRANIEHYFGSQVEGYNTYRYYEGNTKLRSWICLPLVMGMYDRSAQTQAALLSPKLWTKDGMLTESGSTTFWDRSTLYAFRGLLKAGATDTVLSYLSYYSAKRLLGDHVPYAIEAWPEGNQRHLSAESGLYCRTIVEGLFGFDPVGFKEFIIYPRLPKNWNRMSLKNINAFNTNFDITVQRIGGNYRVTVKEKNRPAKMISWDGEKQLHFKL